MCTEYQVPTFSLALTELLQAYWGVNQQIRISDVSLILNPLLTGFQLNQSLKKKQHENSLQCFCYWNWSSLDLSTWTFAKLYWGKHWAYSKSFWKQYAFWFVECFLFWPTFISLSLSRLDFFSLFYYTLCFLTFDFTEDLPRKRFFAKGWDWTAQLMRTGKQMRRNTLKVCSMR